MSHLVVLRLSPSSELRNLDLVLGIKLESQCAVQGLYPLYSSPNCCLVWGHILLAVLRGLYTIARIKLVGHLQDKQPGHWTSLALNHL